jgi:acetyl-CoA synthetase
VLARSQELLVPLLGSWRLGAVHVPLFTAFAPPQVQLRLAGSAARVVVCDTAQRPKLAGLATGAQVVTVGAPEPGDVGFADLLAGPAPGFPAAAVGGAAPVILLYTSGTTGRPKGVPVPAAGIAAFAAYLEYGVDLGPDDVYWNAADPGWGYGLYYGVIGALLSPARSILLHAAFSPELTWAVLARFGVTNMGAAPTVYRALRAAELPPPAGLRLRRASSAGEPLTPEVNQWARQALGVAVHDHYGQSETGMVVNNHHHPALRRPLRTGSMGHPLPGWTVTVLRHDRDEPAPVGAPGRICIDLPASPLAFFRGYLDEPEKSAEKFSPDGRWYVTGDSGHADADGYVYFQSRDDDVIIMAGYRIGPFEVESVLVTHPAVAEAAVVAAPDELRGEALEAHVVLRRGLTGSPELEAELQQLVKREFAAHAYPRRVHFVPELPKTASGKVQRYQLRRR